MIRLKDLSKSFHGPEGPVRALEGVSLTVGTGEFVAVQGPSGSGKTTLLLITGGLLAPDSGQVQVAGQEPYGLSADRRARFRAETIGFVFQQFHLIPYLNVRDNILAPTLAGGPADGQTHRRADELIERFGLTGRAKHTPAGLSTGERQRTALARALLNDPKLLLADEPTGNLDHDNAKTVLGYMAEFAQAGGAVLLVTHHPEASAAAQRTVRLLDGRLE